MMAEWEADTSLYFAQAMLPEGWARDVRIGIRQGKIAWIAADTAAQPGDERHAIGLPGLPNVHSHAFQRAIAGMAELRGPGSDSFWTWREVMYRFIDRIGPPELAAIATLAYMEMLERGFTRVAEFHYLHHDPAGHAYADPSTMAQAIVAAASVTGIGLTLLPVFYAHSGFGGTAPTLSQRRFLHDPDSFARVVDATRHATAGLPDAVVGIAPHSLRAVTPAELAAIVPLGGSGPIHIHIAEQQQEVADCVAWSGTSPVAWLLDHCKIDEQWCLVHATHVTPDESQRVAQSGAVVGLCPITEANLGDGVFAAAPFLAAGGGYGIGSDSNVLIDATEELRLLEYGQRLQLRQRNVLVSGNGQSTGGGLFRDALSGGASATGVAAGIVVGAAADLVSLDARHPCFVGATGDRCLDALIFAAGRDAIDCVWRRGQRLVSQGRHRAREAITAAYLTAMNQILVDG